MLGLIDNLGFGEFMIVGIAALLIFGKRLPEVAAQAGSQLAKLRRSLDTMRRETGIDREIQNMRSEISNAVPRDVVSRDLSIGEMARMATREIQASLREVETLDSTPKAAIPPSTATPLANAAPESTPAATPAKTPTNTSAASDAAPASIAQSPTPVSAIGAESAPKIGELPRDAAGGAP